MGVFAMAGIAAVILLVTITVALDDDDDPPGAGGPAPTTATPDDADDSLSPAEGTGDDTSTSVRPASDASSTTSVEGAADRTTTSTTSTTNQNATSTAGPPTTITATLPSTTITAGPPPATDVVTPPPTTIVVTLPPFLTTTVPPTAPLVGCEVLGTDEFGDILIELTVESPTSTVGLLEATFVLNDSAGSEIISDFLRIDFMSPGEVARLTVETFETVPPGNDVSALSCSIDAVDESDLFENQRLPAPDDTCSVLGVDDVGDLQLTTTVRNPSSEEADVIFTFAVRDAEGVRVISDVGFADELGAGQIVTQEVDTLTAPGPEIDVAALTCDIVGLELF